MVEGKMHPKLIVSSSKPSVLLLQYISTELQRVYIDNIIISDHSYEAMGL